MHLYLASRNSTPWRASSRPRAASAIQKEHHLRQQRRRHDNTAHMTLPLPATVRSLEGTASAAAAAKMPRFQTSLETPATRLTAAA